MQWLVGIILATTISFAAWHLGSLSADGAFAAAGLGTLVFGLGGWNWAALLLIFFVSSSGLSHVFRRRKLPMVADYSKGGRRDPAQVLSNGGIAAVCVLLHLVFAQASWPWLAYGGALAAVNADTWATELGVLDGHRPRLITNLSKRVERGTSGGVSLVGTLAAVLGSAAIAAPAAAFMHTNQCLFFVLMSLSGLFGSLLDSVLGATVQAMYYCPNEGRETEKYPTHSCGTPTVHIRGWTWLNNDGVNVVCSTGGALMTLFLVVILRG